MALWFPDWPVHAARIDAHLAGDIAIVAQHRIWACSASARQHGVRRGMKARAAQALSASLQLIPQDCERDARCFEPVVSGLDSVVASIEVLRPGLAVVDAGAVARFYGGEDVAAQLVMDAAALQGVDCFIGVADNIPTAVLAARASTLVPPGGNADFLRGLATNLLLAEESLGCDPDTVQALLDLGLLTLGEVAALPAGSMTTRFGAPGQHVMRLARGEEQRKVAPEWEGSALDVSATPDSPISRVDAAAFLARGLAAQLHDTLRTAGVVCQRLRVQAVLLENGAERVLERTWRTHEPLTEAATADRVRWQLDGWLTARALDGGAGAEGDAGAAPEPDPDNGIVLLTLEPLEVSAPEKDGLWGGGDDRTSEVRQVVSRVQSALGIEAVLQPIPAGGHGPVERVELVPFGEERGPTRPAAGTWAGQLPGPLPARGRHPAAAFRLVDARGENVYVTQEAVLSSAPAACAWGSYRGRVTGWAGPWPVSERWWEPKHAPACARLQVVSEQDETPRAFLLVWIAGKWRVEASYD